ncbi:MAG: metalloprotease PmbA [Gammaproteobacteria bacterium]|nr:metalloprotease PmbA [Gammaproteobacteria bacterium]
MNIFDKSHYENLSADILEKAKKQGASHAEVTMSLEAGFTVSSRLKQVETVEHHHDKGIGITVFFGQQSGSASSSDLSPLALDTTIAKACNIAKYTSSDPYSGLAEKSQMAFDYPDLNLDHPWEITPEAALDFTIECETLAMENPRITNSEGSSLSSHRSLQVYANTHGFTGSYLTTQHSLNCVLIAQENGHMHRDYDYTIARNAADMKKIEDLARKASEKTINRLGARRLTTRTAPVVFSADIAKSLLSNYISATSGGSIYRKSSFLVDHLNKPVFPSHISLTQHPHLPKAVGSAPFDGEGVRTLKQDFVCDGVLQNYILSSYSARKLGMQTTGNAGGVYNLLITTSDLSFEELLKNMDTGLLVTELIGQGVNIVTGDYSRGAFGYWVENGKIQYPVEEITIAGNLQEMFMNIVAVSNDIDTRSRIHTGSILIDSMTIAGE